MLWFFNRDHESLRLHTQYDNESKEFVATMKWSDGRSDQLRFSGIDSFGDWLKQFETALEEQNWKAERRPVVLREGWPDKPLS